MCFGFDLITSSPISPHPTEATRSHHIFILGAATTCFDPLLRDPFYPPSLLYPGKEQRVLLFAPHLLQALLGDRNLLVNLLHLKRPGDQLAGGAVAARRIVLVRVDAEGHLAQLLELIEVVAKSMLLAPSRQQQ